VKKPTEGEGIRRADGLADIRAGATTELEGLSCEYGEKVSHFPEPLVSWQMAVTVGTMFFPMVGPEDLITDERSVFDSSGSPSTLCVRSLVTVAGLVVGLGTFVTDEVLLLLETTEGEGSDFFGILCI
jgi:hypothetical protein